MATPHTPPPMQTTSITLTITHPRDATVEIGQPGQSLAAPPAASKRARPDGDTAAGAPVTKKLKPKAVARSSASANRNEGGRCIIVWPDLRGYPTALPVLRGVTCNFFGNGSAVFVNKLRKEVYMKKSRNRGLIHQFRECLEGLAGYSDNRQAKARDFIKSRFLSLHDATENTGIKYLGTIQTFDVATALPRSTQCIFLPYTTAEDVKKEEDTENLKIKTEGTR